MRLPHVANQFEFPLRHGHAMANDLANGTARPRRRVAPDVYLPIEIVKREYAGHLLVAVELASRGINAIIGHKSNGVNKLAKFARHPGVMFYKSVLRNPYLDGGFLGVSQDPEAGIAWTDFTDFFQIRPDFKDLATSEAYFCYGQDDLDGLRRLVPEAADRLVLAGSPRALLWGDAGAEFYRDQTEHIRDRYGDFVLFCSREKLAYPRTKSGTLPIKQATIEHFGSREAAEESVRKETAQSKQISDNFLRAADEIARSSGLNVVIRPHPGESWDHWHRATRHNPRLFVDSAFDLSPWARAARALVQNGSTAAFESWYAGTPTIAFGETADELDSGTKVTVAVPNRISLRVVGIDALKETLLDVDVRWQQFLSATEFVELARKLHHPAEGPTKVIADVIEPLVDPALPSGVARPWHPGYLLLRAKMFVLARRMRQEFLGSQTPFPDKRRVITKDEIVRDVERAKAIVHVTDELSVKRLSANCFLISKR